MAANNKKKPYKLFCGAFSLAIASALMTVEYLRKEPNYALLTQAIGLIVFGVGIIIGKPWT